MTLPATTSLPRLSRSLVPESRAGSHVGTELPERVLQFGEGNFLRAFVDWMLCRLNEGGQFGGRVVVVQPLDRGMADAVNEQDGLFTVILRGVSSGKVREERQLVDTVSRAINPYTDAYAWLETAKGPDLRFVVSNTTEAGIALDPDDSPSVIPSPSFPAKLTQWLYARYSYFDGDSDKGVVILPCELIEHNGRKLRELVFELSRSWGLPAGFASWLESSCIFTTTLVDRIVTGYPRAEADELCRELGYEDRLLVAGEIYHCWVIESPEPLESELPLEKAGLNVIWTKDAAPYRERKVRILNGAHTAMTVVGLLAGFDTVRACMQDAAMRGYVEHLLRVEICPSLEGDAKDNEAFAQTVLERFENPFVRHELSSIALNSVSKFRARLLGSFVDHVEREKTLPGGLCLSLAALFVLYRNRDGGMSQSNVSLRPRDEPRIIELLDGAWREHAPRRDGGDYERLVRGLLVQESLWGRDLTKLHEDLVSVVAREVGSILEGRVADRLLEISAQ